jgi:prepilin-type N-terminal cleavage/methylation domain-containing protein
VKSDRPVLLRPERRSTAAEDGMTLVELLVAIAVMLIVLAGVAAGATSGLRLAQGNSSRIVAANVADEHIGDVRAMEFADIPQTTVSGTVTRGGIAYTWTREAEMVFVGADEACEAPSGAFNANRLSYLRVVVEVTWPAMGQIEPVRSETLVDPPVAEFDPYRGHLAVRVSDREGAAVPGMQVYLRNADSATPTIYTFDTTDDNGCVFFDNLAVIDGQTVGNYYVWLDRAGWVDRASGLSNTSLQSPRPVVNVVSAQLRKLEFNYDREARLNVSLAGAFGGVPPLGLPVTIAADNYNNGNGPVPFASTAALAATPLHPFSSGFSLWAGQCTDADPGAVERVRLTTDPGVVSTGVVTMGTAEMTVYRRVAGNDVPIVGGLIRATDRCGNTYTAALPTNTSGTATLALPYGRWTLSLIGASPHPPGLGWPQVTLSATDAARTAITQRVQ